MRLYEAMLMRLSACLHSFTAADISMQHVGQILPLNLNRCACNRNDK